MPDFTYPVPPDPPDEGSQITVQFGIAWLPLVLDAVDNLEPASLFEDPPDDISGQIDQLLTLLMTDVTMPPQVYPPTALHFHRDSIVISGGAVTFAAVTGEMFAGIWAQTAAQVGDTFRFPVFLAAGTYQLRFNWRRISSGGKLTVKVDNSTVISAFDTYGTTLGNQMADQTITIASDGEHVVEGSVSTKNASSSGYAIQLGVFYFRRTGA